MAVTWGSMRETMRHTLTENANLERECLEQAKLEICGTGLTAIELVHEVLARAQQIKAEKKAGKR
jgi:NADH dehydrogenase FAD-containing subunit